MMADSIDPNVVTPYVTDATIKMPRVVSTVILVIFENGEVSQSAFVERNKDGLQVEVRNGKGSSF